MADFRGKAGTRDACDGRNMFGAAYGAVRLLGSMDQSESSIYSPSLKKRAAPGIKY